jgi:hypothetical protein
MRGFTNLMKRSLLRLATALLIGMAFAFTTSVASAGVVIDINKVVIVKPKVIVKNPMPSANKVLVFLPAKQTVKPEATSRVVRPFGVRPFFARPFGFNPFFNADFDFD